jgi:hypothetical protein
VGMLGAPVAPPRLVAAAHPQLWPPCPAGWRLCPNVPVPALAGLVAPPRLAGPHPSAGSTASLAVARATASTSAAAGSGAPHRAASLGSETWELYLYRCLYRTPVQVTTVQVVPRLPAVVHNSQPHRSFYPVCGLRATGRAQWRCRTHAAASDARGGPSRSIPSARCRHHRVCNLYMYMTLYKHQHQRQCLHRRHSCNAGPPPSPGCLVYDWICNAHAMHGRYRCVSL